MRGGEEEARRKEAPFTSVSLVSIFYVSLYLCYSFFFLSIWLLGCRGAGRRLGRLAGHGYNDCTVRTADTRQTELEKEEREERQTRNPEGEKRRVERKRKRLGKGKREPERKGKHKAREREKRNVRRRKRKGERGRRGTNGMEEQERRTSHRERGDLQHMRPLL